MAAEAVALVPCPHCGQKHPDAVLVCPTTHHVLPLEGRIIADKFRLRRQLGEGGMSTVWEAENVLVRKKLAIKLLLPEILSNPNSLMRFRNEATSAGRIGSPHICDILDFGQCEAGPYIVMEMLRGRDLAKALEEYRRFEPGLAVLLIRQALRGLLAAHKAGIIHRDLKPENLFLHESEPGHVMVKLMDFGISKFTEGGLGNRTATGVLMGTPSYMSPEQIQGAAMADERTDIWAMGVILYYALSGSEPFRAETLAGILMAITTVEPRPVRELNPAVPAGLSDIVMRCLAKAQDSRYSTVQELLDVLEPYEQTGAAKGLTLQYQSGAHSVHNGNLTPPSQTGGIPVELSSASAQHPVARPQVMPAAVAQVPPQGGMAQIGVSVAEPRQNESWNLGTPAGPQGTQWLIGPAGSSPATFDERPPGDHRPRKKSNALLWVGLLGGLLIAGGAGAWWMKGSNAVASGVVVVDPTSTSTLATSTLVAAADPSATSTAVNGGQLGDTAVANGQTTTAPAVETTQVAQTTTVEPEVEEKTPVEPTKPRGTKPKTPKDTTPPKLDLSKVVRMPGGYYVPISDPAETTWAEAKSRCTRMRRETYGGLRDWALPSTSVLLGFQNSSAKTLRSRYWTAHSVGRAVDTVILSTGSIKTADPGDRARALCVARK